MAKRNNMPLKVRDAFVTKQAYKLLNSMGFVSLPVDPFAIVESFGWKAYTVEAAEAFGIKCPFNLNEKTSAVSFKIPRTGKCYIIYYEERYIPRLRWSIAHEIGHIVLEHKNEFPNKLTEAEYSVAEIEANLFAAELLAPTRIIASDMFVRSANNIATKCFISPEATSKKLELFNGTRLLTPMSIMSREGEELYRNMYNYLLDISEHWTDRLNEKDILLPSQFDDYTFCDYWEYVKSKMKRKHKALFALIDNSVTFYDNKNMILFVANVAAVKIDNLQKNAIIENLTKYASSPIRNIVSIFWIA